MKKQQREIELLRSRLEKIKEETLQSKALEKITLDEIKKQFDCSNLNDLIELKKELEDDNEKYNEEVDKNIEEIKSLIKKHGIFYD